VKADLAADFCHCEKILDERRILLDRKTDSKAVSEVAVRF